MPMPPGHQQSPIDIVRTDVEPRSDLPPLGIHYPSEAVSVEVCVGVVDGDETPQGAIVVPQLIVTPTEPGAHVTLGDRRFDLQSFHWHSPSEHLIDGMSFPLELHLVHASADGSLLVLGVLVEEGGTDAAIAPAFDLVQGLGAEALGGRAMPCASTWMRLADLVPEVSPTHRYDGSLTTSPFTEGVAWFVCTVTRQASAEQIDAHMTLVSTPLPGFGDRPQPPGNARCPQDRLDRVVVTET